MNEDSASERGAGAHPPGRAHKQEEGRSEASAAPRTCVECFLGLLILTQDLK